MTSVDSFRANPNGSLPLVILSLFNDLVESKGLIFVRCDAVAKEHVSKFDLTFCLDYLRAFYTDSNLYKDCVVKFNHQSRDFDYKEFMRKTSPIRFQLYQGAAFQPRNNQNSATSIKHGILNC